MKMSVLVTMMKKSSLKRVFAHLSKGLTVDVSAARRLRQSSDTMSVIFGTENTTNAPSLAGRVLLAMEAVSNLTSDILAQLKVRLDKQSSYYELEESVRIKTPPDKNAEVRLYTN